MSLRMIAACIVVAIALAAGQVLFKLAATQIASRSGTLLSALASPWLAVALLVYAIATALWIWVLTQVPLTRAYPFALVSMAMVPIAGALLFSEPLSARYLVGFGLVLAGLAVIQSA
ncbi:transporter [Salinarimonas sp.]|uniref:transporter n=1 Tax=Salinarimonas sp. TaxID=2766526 RepID=UPI00391CB449